MIPVARGQSHCRVVIAAASAMIGMSVSCRPDAASDSAGSPQRREPTWIEASGAPQADVLARHPRGLGFVMVELDHRYAEGYFAARLGTGRTLSTSSTRYGW